MTDVKWISAAFPVTDWVAIKAQLLAWASGYSSCAFLDNNQYASDLHRVDCIAAVGCHDAVVATAGRQALSHLQHFIDKHRGEWLFGHLGYSLKAETEGIKNNLPTTHAGFADLRFFVPDTVVRLQVDKLVVESIIDQPEVVWNKIQATLRVDLKRTQTITLQPLLSREQYLQRVTTLQQHIRRGDCYEVNFCLPFLAEKVTLQPVPVFEHLCQLSPMPFACFYRQQQQYLLCASPERFLQKQGNHIFSQPMKGTAPRHDDPDRDAVQVEALQTSSKERSENVMVADLVRNDLSKICKEGTVTANRLFGIQTYPQVHQMVSTISGELREDVSFTDILRATFPMGSMTGAPKKRVLELIDTYEPLPRGLFSGSVGYIDPAGNFDFNVVIRSLLYDADLLRLQYFAGSAITFYSNAAQEFEEVLLKTKAVRTILENTA